MAPEGPSGAVVAPGASAPPDGLAGEGDVDRFEGVGDAGGGVPEPGTTTCEPLVAVEVAAPWRLLIAIPPMASTRSTTTAAAMISTGRDRRFFGSAEGSP